jgi:hypothetical protein
VSSRGLRRANAINRGVRVLSLCWPACEAESYLGWVPPTWINAVAREVDAIRQELSAQG